MTSEVLFATVIDQYERKLPFVIYRKPNQPILNCLLQEDVKLYTIDDYKDSGFVFAPFNSKKQTILIPSEKSTQFKVDYESNSESTSFEKPLLKTNLEPVKQQHILLVKKGIDAIKNKEFEKVVLSRVEKIDVGGPDPISIFKKLCANYKNTFTYCWYHPKIGLWLGATPEALISVQGQQISTIALAGTQVFNEGIEAQWGHKEQEEQQLVTNFIVDKINIFVNDLRVSEVETVRAGNLLHLKTKISGVQKNQSQLPNLISALHPTPAVCGLPKDKTKAFILENENYNREFYTGFLGELNFEKDITPRSSKRNIENRAYATKRKESQLFVNLRCMQILNGDVLIYVGGGITKDSIPEKEWEETLAKSEVMKKVVSTL